MRAPFGKELSVSFPHIRAVVGMHRINVVLEACTLAAIVPEKQAQVLVRVEDLAGDQIMFPTSGVAELFGLAQDALALAQRLLGPFALADVAANSHDARLPVVLHDRSSRFNPMPAAGSVVDTPFDPVSPPGQNVLPPLPAVFEIFRVDVIEQVRRILAQEPQHGRACIDAAAIELVEADQIVRVFGQYLKQGLE